MGRKNAVGSLFGRSPIKPLQEHMKSVLECTQQLPSFFEASSSGNWKQAESVYDKIGELENKADDEKREIRLNLPRSLFMPIPRNDFLVMVGYQDKVANTAKDIAGLMLGRQMAFPASMANEVKSFVQSTIAVVVEADTVINELDELLEAGFSGKELKIIEKLVTGLGDLEKQSDDLEIKVRAQLRAIENDLPPIEAMFLYQIIELIGNLADSAQKVGDHLHIIVAR